MHCRIFAVPTSSGVAFACALMLCFVYGRCVIAHIPKSDDVGERWTIVDVSSVHTVQTFTVH